MKKFKSFIFYLLTYILISLTTAFGVVLVSDPTGANTLKIGETATSTTIPPQLNYIMNNLTTIDAVSAKISASVLTKTDAFDINLGIEADFNNGFKNPQVKGDLEVYINGKPTKVLFVYKNEAIFLTIFNKTFRVETNNLVSSVEQILTLLNVEMPNINIGIDLNNFSLDSILGMLTELTEEKQATQTIIKIALPVVGDLTLVCDLNYAIKSISLPLTTIGDVSFKVDASLSYPSKVEVTEPNENILEVTNLFNVAEALINTVNQKELGYNVCLNVSDFSLEGKLNLDLNNYNIGFETNLLNNKLSLALINDIIYLSYGNLRFKFDLADVEKLTDLIQSQFGINLPLDKVVGMLAALKDDTLFSQFNNFDINSFDFNSMDLSIINLNNVSENQYLLALKNIGDITLKLSNKKIEQINFDGSGVNLKLKTSEFRTVEKSSLTYHNVADLIPTVNAILNTAKQKYFSGVINLTFKNKTYLVNYVLQNHNGIYLNLKTQILNKTLEINFVNNNCFITYSNSRLVLKTCDINQIIDLVLEKFNLSKPTIDTAEIKQMLSSLLNPATNQNFIEKLSLTDSVLTVNLLNKLTLSLSGEEKIENLNVKYSDIELNVSINSSLNTITVPSLNINDYTSILDLTHTALSIYDYVMQKEFYFSFNASYNNISVNGSLNYNNDSLSAEAYTTVFGKQIDIKLLDNVIYACIDGLKLKFALSDIDIILDFVKDKFGVDAKSELEKLLTQVNSSDLLAELSNLELEVTNSKIEVLFNNIIATVNIANNNINNIKVLGDGISANVNVLSQPTEIVVAPDYFNLTQMLPLVNSLINTINSKAIGGKLTLKINKDVFDINIKVDFSSTIRVWAQTTIYGCDVRLNLVNNIVYASVDGLNIKLGLDEIDKLINFVNTNLNLNISLTDLTNIKFDPAILDQIHLSDIKFLEVSPYHFVANIFGYPITIRFGQTLEQIFTQVNDVYVNFGVNALGSEVTFPNINFIYYENIDYLLDLAADVINLVKSKNINILGSVTYSNTQFDVNANVDFSEDLKANVNLSAFGKQISVIVDNMMAYINADGFTGKFDLTKTSDFIHELESAFNININKTLNKSPDIYIKKLAHNNDSLIATIYLNGNPINVTLKLNENNTLNSVSVSAFGLTANLALEKSNNVISVNPSEYKTNLNSLTGLLSPVAHIINNSKLAVNGEIKLKLFNNTQALTIKNLSVDFSKDLTVYALVALNDIEAEVMLKNNTAYLTVFGLKVKFNLSDINNLINWINTSFAQNITLPDANIDIEQMLNKFSLGIINEIFLTPNGICINLNLNGSTENLIFVDYTSTLDKITGELCDVYFNLNFDSNIQIPTINTQEFNDYTALTDFVDDVVGYFKSKQYNINAIATVYNGETVRFNANAKLSADISNQFALSGSAKLTGEQDMEFDLNYYNKYLFVNYNNLKIKICENDLKELLVIVMEMFGVDPTILPFLNDVANGMNVNIGNISNIIPSNNSNPLEMLNIIKQINFESGNLSLILNEKLISENPNANEMLVNISTLNNSLNNISIKNLYTGVTENEYFNLDVIFDKFVEVTPPNDNNNEYIDISGANELIKAIVNTAELTYYEIEGSLNVNGSLIGIPISWNVPFNVKVKLDEDRNPEIMMVIGEIPTMVGVNNDVPYKGGDTESGHNRMLYAYYKSGYVYIYRSEYVNRLAASARRYEKKLKVAIEEFLENPLDYLQFGVGFSDDIMGAIRSSLELSNGHTPNLGNIINWFRVNNKTDFSVELNMREITNDPKMDTMTIGLNVINNEETNNKNYVGTASFNMFMPLASVFELTLDSNDLKLINIGKTLDFAPLYDYINSYTYKENVAWEASNGNWTQSSEKTYTLTFVTNCNLSVDNIVAPVDTPISIPTFGDRVDDNINEHIRNIYRFDGWFTTPNFKTGTLFNLGTMPRGGKTLYAKWTLINTLNIVLLSFDSLGGTNYNTILDTPGSNINVLDRVPHKHDDKVKGSYKFGKGNICYHTRYTFEGWFVDSSLTIKFDGKMPNSNTTLYAKYSSYTFDHYWGAFGTSCNEHCC